jgi:hypothetical protein
MAVTPSNLHVNTLDVMFTPTGGTDLPIIRITKSDVDGGVSNISFKGDGDLFPTSELNVSQVPTVTFTGGNVGAIMAAVAGTVGQLTMTWPDSRNGIAAGGGGIEWTLSNAILADKNASAPHAQFASGSTMFSSFSNDGATNPLAMTFL